ncbi:ultra-long-chain fatty acid omega-hydroxylase-like [Argopecten irradians]|uniref:ultra-long-chain fatty acid omega-hydroxylase-like n=2 Tax=Argopecten irradians TaxID=31199 RepID=UPI00371B7DB0
MDMMWPIPNLNVLVTVSLAVVIVCKLIHSYLRYTRWVKSYEQLPGSQDTHWFWGHMHLYPGPNEKGLAFQRERIQEFPLFHRIWVSYFRCVLICHHPKSVKFLLKSSEPKPTEVGTSYVLGKTWLGDGLLLANGKRWARNRRLLTPAFHFDILQPYMTVYNEVSDILQVKIGDCCEKGEAFELFNFIGMASLDNILRCAFSYKSDCQVLGDSHPYVNAVNKLSDLWVARSLNIFHYFDFIFFLSANGRQFKKYSDYVHSVAEEVIQKRQLTLEKEGLPNGRKSRYQDFLDILLTAKDENNVGMTPLEIRNEVDTFLFEGHDTTTSAMCWTLYSLAEHPQWQKKIQAEVDGILEGRDLDFIEWSDLGKLENLTLCIKEGLRLHSPVSFIQRNTTKPFEVEGYHVPVGTSVAIQIYNLHHNPYVWDDPMEFRPERFLPENSVGRDSYAFVPFSAGPRNCIGQHFAMNEQKVTLARLLRRFTFELDPKHEVSKKIGVVMRAENGIKVFAKPRKL